MAIHGSLMSEIITNGIILFFILMALTFLAVLVYRKKRLSRKYFASIVLLSLLLSSLYCCFLVAYYSRTAVKVFAVMKDAFTNSTQIKVTYFDRQNPITQKQATLNDTDKINLIEKVIFDNEYMVRSPKGLASIIDPMEIYFFDNPDIVLIVLGNSGAIEIIDSGLKVRLVSTNESLYSEIEKLIWETRETMDRHL